MNKNQNPGRRTEWLSLIAGAFVWFLVAQVLNALPFNTRIPLEIVLSIVLVLGCIALHIFYRRYFLEGLLAVVGGGLSFQLWTSTDRYAFVSNPDHLHFWQTSAAVALVVMLALLLGEYWVSKYTPLSRKKTTLSLLTVLCAGAVVFGQCEAGLTHLNVAWDSSAPTRHICQVEGNWEERVGRSGTIITLLLNKNGERISLHRDRVEYEAGETVCLLECAGAFGEAYYIVEGDR